jgi:hypothetical protein
MGKLIHLRQLVWDDIPSELCDWIQKHAPKVSVIRSIDIDNYTDIGAKQGEGQIIISHPMLHGEDLHTSPQQCESLLDQMAIRCLDKEEQDDHNNKRALLLGGGNGHSSPRSHHYTTRAEIPIAERFRYAYIMRSNRLSEKYAKEGKRRLRKEIRESGTKGAKNLVQRWLDDESIQ